MSNFFDFTKGEQYKQKMTPEDHFGELGAWSGYDFGQALHATFGTMHENHSVTGVRQRYQRLREAEQDESRGWISVEEMEPELREAFKGEKATKVHYELVRKSRAQKDLYETKMSQYYQTGNPNVLQQLMIFGGGMAGTALSYDDLALNLIPYRNIIAGGLKLGKFTKAAKRIREMSSFKATMGFQGTVSALENIAIGKADQQISKAYAEEYTDLEVLGSGAAAFVLSGIIMPGAGRGLARTVGLTGKAVDSAGTTVARKLPEGKVKEKLTGHYASKDAAVKTQETVKALVNNETVKGLEKLESQNLHPSTIRAIYDGHYKSFVEGIPFEEVAQKIIAVDELYRASTFARPEIDSIKVGEFKEGILNIQRLDDGGISVFIAGDSGIAGGASFLGARNADLPTIKSIISDLYKALDEPRSRTEIFSRYETALDNLNTLEARIFDAPNPNQRKKAVADLKKAVGYGRMPQADDEIHSVISNYRDYFSIVPERIAAYEAGSMKQGQDFESILADSFTSQTQMRKEQVSEITGSERVKFMEELVGYKEQQARAVERYISRSIRDQKGLPDVFTDRELEDLFLDLLNRSRKPKKTAKVRAKKGSVELDASGLRNNIRTLFTSEGLTSEIVDIRMQRLERYLPEEGASISAPSSSSLFFNLRREIGETVSQARAQKFETYNPIKEYTNKLDMEVRDVREAYSADKFERLIVETEKASDAVRLIAEQLEGISARLKDPTLSSKGQIVLKEKRGELNKLLQGTITDIGVYKFKHLADGAPTTLTEGIVRDVYSIKVFLTKDLKMDPGKVNRIFSSIYTNITSQDPILRHPETKESIRKADALLSLISGRPSEELRILVDEFKSKITASEDASMFLRMFQEHYEGLRQQEHLLVQEKLNYFNNFYRMIREGGEFRAKDGHPANVEEMTKTFLVNSTFNAEGARYGLENLQESLSQELLAAFQKDLIDSNLLEFYTNTDKAHLRKLRESILYQTEPEGLVKPNEDYMRAGQIFNNHIQRRNRMLNTVGANLEGKGSLFDLNPEALIYKPLIRDQGKEVTFGEQTKYFFEELFGGPSKREQAYQKSKDALWQELVIGGKLNLKETFEVHGIAIDKENTNVMRSYFDHILDNYTKGMVFHSTEGPVLTLKDTQNKLIFNSNKDMLDFVSEYGYDSISDQLMADVRRASRTYGALKMFGPSVKDHFTNLVKAGSKFHGVPYKEPRRMYSVIAALDGTGNVPENLAIATLFGGIRAFDMRKLWSATLKSGSDFPNNISAFSNAFGMVDHNKFMTLWKDMYGMAALDHKKAEKMAIRLGLNMDIFQYNIMETYSVGKAVAKWSRNFQDKMMQVNLLRSYINAQERAQAGLVSIELNDLLTRMPDVVPAEGTGGIKYLDARKYSGEGGDLLRRYGIRMERNEHKIIQAAARISKGEMEEFMGRKIDSMTDDMLFLSPIELRGMSNEDFFEIVINYHRAVPAEHKQRFDSPTDPRLEIYKNELASKLGALVTDIADEAVTKPRAHAMSYIRSPLGGYEGARPGTWEGEMWRTAMLFKSFPVARMMQDFGRVINKGRDPVRHAKFRDWIISPEFFDVKKGPIPNLISFMGAVMMMEYLGLVGTAWLMGTPEAHDSEFAAKVFERTCIFGPFGEMILSLIGPSRYNRVERMSSSFFGPAIGGWTNSLKNLGTDIHSQEDEGYKILRRAVRSFTQDSAWRIPLIHIPMRMHILDPLNEWIEPGYMWERSKRLNRQDRDMIGDGFFDL